MHSLIHSKQKNTTLFLDRDGVINQRLPGAYVSRVEDFHFCEGALEALKLLASLFPRIFIVTNQQGIGKGLMTEDQLAQVHQHLLTQVRTAGGRIDRIYYCKELAGSNPLCRKPRPGMALQAQKEFPEIDFQNSIMVGDSISDMEFAQALNMQTVFIETKPEAIARAGDLQFDHRFPSLYAFSQYCSLGRNK